MITYCYKIIEVIVINIPKENLKLLELLSIMFSHSTKYVTYNLVNEVFTLKIFTF